MADLDDFFAKKDKKKKTKKGFSKANTEVLAKNLEENDRKEQQAEEKANDMASRGQRFIENQQGLSKEADAEEWKEYEDTKLDYSNLKIDTLKLEDDADPGDGDDVNEDGEKVKKSKEGGTWSKLVASDSLENENEDKSSDSVKEDSPEPAPITSGSNAAGPNASAPSATKSSSYVPPHLRGSVNSAATPSPAAGPRGPGRRQKHAPDINNEVFFPSLSAAMGTDDPNKGQGQANSNRGFEEVKSGGSQSYNSRDREAPKLSLDNKFAALRD